MGCLPAPPHFSPSWNGLQQRCGAASSASAASPGAFQKLRCNRKTIQGECRNNSLAAGDTSKFCSPSESFRLGPISFEGLRAGAIPTSRCPALCPAAAEKHQFRLVSTTSAGLLHPEHRALTQTHTVPQALIQMSPTVCPAIPAFTYLHPVPGSGLVSRAQSCHSLKDQYPTNTQERESSHQMKTGTHSSAMQPFGMAATPNLPSRS